MRMTQFSYEEASISDVHNHKGNNNNNNKKKNNNFAITSANLCKWILDYFKIQVGKQIGCGSYRVVF